LAPFDVCIVGFGPTGAVAACLLGSAGYKVCVIDRLTDVYDKPRAIALDHEIMRAFQNLGIAEEISPYVAPYPASVFVGVDGQVIQRLDAAPPPFSQGWAPNYSFSQPPVEACLRACAERNANVTVLLGQELISIVQDADGVDLQMRTQDGLATARARYVIGADGANSTVRRLCAIALEDLDFDEPWLVVDVKVNEDSLTSLPDISIQYCEPSRPATYVVGPGNHRRWEIMLTEEDDPADVVKPDRLWQLLRRWVAPETAKIWRSATYRFHAVVAERWRQKNVFLAGDAAHQQPPFLGQGMCQGIRDAVNLSWKLDVVMRGLAPDALLDTYGEERRDHVVRLIEVVKRLGRFVCERDEARARERDATLIAAMGGKIVTTIRQEIMPGLATGLLSKHETSANGTLFPQPRLSDGRLLDEALGQGFRLILSADATLPKANLARFPGLQVAQIATGGGTYEGEEGGPRCLTELDQVVANWFQRHGAVAALVRPDNYVFGVAKADTEIALLVEDCADRLVMPPPNVSAATRGSP
jgi:3-(3-hydroxy-phenyl)propionate hydroxylase